MVDCGKGFNPEVDEKKEGVMVSIKNCFDGVGSLDWSGQMTRIRGGGGMTEENRRFWVFSGVWCPQKWGKLGCAGGEGYLGCGEGGV